MECADGRCVCQQQIIEDDDAMQQPPLTQVPLVSMPMKKTEKKERKKRMDAHSRIPPQATTIPKSLTHFTQQVNAQGGVVESCLRAGNGKWDLKVFIPTGSALQKPDFSAGWFGHTLHTHLSSVPVKHGMIIETVINEVAK